VGEIYELIIRARPRIQPLIYFWLGGDRQSGKSDIRQ